MALKHCGVVDSEDGLLLFGGAATLQLWRGSDNEQVQFTRIESIFQEGLAGLSIPIAQGTGVIWNLEGSGTADVFSDETLGKIEIVRSWLDDSEDTETVFALSSAPAALNGAFAEFQVNSGFLALFSPIEEGDCIHNTEQSRYFLSEQDMMTETSGMLLPVLNGRYLCFHDDVKIEQGEARRCHIINVHSVTDRPLK